MSTAARFEDARSKLANDPPAIVITEHVLIGARGFDVVDAALRADPRPFVIYLIRDVSGPEARSAVEAGADVLMGTPVDRQELLRAIKRRLQELGPQEEAAPGGGVAVSAGLEAIWQRYRPVILEQVRQVEDAAVAGLEGRLDHEQQRAAEREAHKLAGSLGTFGYLQASQVARELEHVFAEPRLSPGDLFRTSELVVSLRAALEQDPAAPAGAAGHEETAPDEGPQPLLALADRDAAYKERLRIEAESRGFRVADADMLTARPDIVVLDPAGSAASLDLLDRWAQEGESVPALIVSASDSLEDRLAAARRGGRGFLRKPAAPSEVLDAAQRLIPRGEGQQTRVLAVDDDPLVLDAVRQLLGSRGFDVETVSDPLRFWDVLQRTSPDLVILDVDMPHVSGIELCRVVRNDPTWATLPVLFLTSARDDDTIVRIFAAGADDYVAKPVVGPELLARIDNRLERGRLLRKVGERDPVTRLLQRRHALPQIESYLATATRLGQPLSFAALDVDALRTINESAGHAAGDEALALVGEVLARHFRSDDVVARWAGEEFVVAMLGIPVDGAVRRLAEALEELREMRLPSSPDISLTFTGGVAVLPENGTSIEELYRQAVAATRVAKERGMDRIWAASWESEAPSSADRVDVVVVEDDEPLARLLAHGLETRGYSTRWLPSGEEADDLLVGESPDLRARVVLLDVDLPGLDGLSILRRLADTGVLRSTRVVMLTARSAEIEVLKAMEIGAFDHVAKPFSVPVLMQRIRRALDA